MSESTAAPPSTQPHHSDKLDAGVIRIAVVVVLGAIMSILDTTVVAVAQNTFQTVFHTSAANAAWTATGYTLALAAVIPLSSWASSRFGTRNVYLVSLVLFVAGSVLCAFASNIGMLVAFRMVQGIGGGMLMPVGMMILTRAAGPERVGSIMAVLGIPMLLGPIGGPILGGLLIQYASWHWVFLINVPIGIAAFTYAFVTLPKGEATSKPSLDLIGLLLLSPGLALFLYGVSSSNEAGTFIAAKVLIPMIIGVVLIAGFVVRSFTASKPLLDLTLFGNPKLSWAVVTMVLFMAAFFGAMLLYPQYFIGVRGESTLMAGLLVAPQGIGAMVTMPVAGRMTDQIGPGKFVLSGIVLIVAGMSAFIFLGAHTSYWLLLPALFVQGLGMGMTMMPIMSSALATLTHDKVPDGSTLMNVVQQTAASIGTAVISVILASKLKSDPMSGLAIMSNAAPKQYAQIAAAKGLPPVAPTEWLHKAAEAFGGTFIIAVVLVAITFIPALFLPRKRVAPEGEDMPIMLH